MSRLLSSSEVGQPGSAGRSSITIVGENQICRAGSQVRTKVGGKENWGVDGTTICRLMILAGSG